MVIALMDLIYGTIGFLLIVAAPEIPDQVAGYLQKVETVTSLVAAGCLILGVQHVSFSFGTKKVETFQFLG